MEKVPFLDYKEILVIGGTGFVGRHVCRALIARGWLPRLLVRIGSEEKIPEDVRRACRVTTGDAIVREFVENAAQGTEAIVNLAGIIREFPGRGSTFEKVHVDATRHALDAAKAWGIRRFVHVSALGAAAGSPNRYFDSKGRSEDLVRRSDLAWTVFRPSGIFGPGDRFIAELDRAVRRAPFFPVPGDGNVLLQPVFVGDVVKGIADCLTRPDTEGRVFDVGGPERFTYDALVDRIAERAGVRLRKVRISAPRMRRAVGFLSRFERFPLGPEMVDVLLAGTTCDSGPFLSAFGLDPFPLSRYLASPAETDFSAAGSASSAHGAESRSREEEPQGREAA